MIFMNSTYMAMDGQCWQPWQVSDGQERERNICEKLHFKKYNVRCKNQNMVRKNRR